MAGAGTRFVPRDLPGGDPAAHVTDNLSGAPYRYQARVTLQAPAEEVLDRSRHMWGTVTAIDARTCEYRTGDDSLD